MAAMQRWQPIKQTTTYQLSDNLFCFKPEKPTVLSRHSDKQMGVSFKVARIGTRYTPRLEVADDPDIENGVEDNLAGKRDEIPDHGNVLVKSGVNLVSEDVEVSFSLNLFPNGFYIGKASELFDDLPKQLHPYDRASESLLTAIEYGWLPGDTFDGLSCNYVNGALLCEIRDYRNCMYEKEGTDSPVNSPIVHKVCLQMHMEKVIKDIISIANDSWTYKDILEVESCILKALQPNLHLNPKPFLDRFCREPLTKKLDLDITWVWKKRKLTDATANNSRFSGQYNKGAPNSQLTISGSICNLQKNNIVPQSISQHNVLKMKRSYQLAESCSRSVVADPSSSNLNHHLREPSLLVSYGEGTSKLQVNYRPILKKPMQEALDFSQQYPAVSQPVNILAADLLKNTSLHHEAKIITHRILRDKRGLSELRNNCQRTTFEGIRKLQTIMPASAVKCEPIEASECRSLDVNNIMGKYFTMDRNNPSNLLQLQLQQSFRSGTNTLRDQMAHDKNSGREIGLQKRNVLQNPQIPAKRKKSSHPNVSSTILGASLTLTGNKNATSCLPVISLPQTSKVEADPLMERFRKIEKLTQRYGLNKRKRNLDKILPEKLHNFNKSRVECHLLDPEEKWKLKDATSEGIPLSECYADRRLNESKTRTLIFVHRSHLHQGIKIPMVDGKARVKLVMSEMLNKGSVEASVHYGHREGIDCYGFPLLPTFHSTYFAALFAAQFTSLMEHEGYYLARERIESTPLEVDNCSNTQQVTVTGGVTPAAVAVQQPFSTLTPGPSTSVFTPVTKSVQAVNYRQLPSTNPLTRSHSRSRGDISSTQQLSRRNLSKMALGIGTPCSPLQQQHWQQSLNKHAHLQFQMLQRHRQQNQLIERLTMLGDFGGGIQGLENISPRSFNSLTGIGGSVQVPGGGQIPWLHNMSRFNNICSKMPSSSDSKQLFGSISDNGVQRRGLMGGYPFGKNASIVPMQAPSMQDMAYLLANQQVMPQNQHLQGMRSVLQPKVENSIEVDDYYMVSCPPSQVRSQRFDKHPPISPLQAGSRSVFQRMNNRNIVFGPAKLEPTTPTHV